MNRKIAPAILITALFLALPLASAQWMGRGWYEPDTLYDRQNGYMWLEPARDPEPSVKAVYFNVWADQDDQSVNPNSALLGSSVMSYPTRMFGMLGVWKDCNGDGFIGQPEGLFQWYPAQLLLRQDICPADPQPYGRPGQTVELVHNDGVWVREFIQIGNERPAPDGNGNDDPYFFSITDNASKMWGDWGLPEEGPINTCAVTPIPEGTLQRTGGALRYADCHAAWRATGTITVLADATGQDQLSFADDPTRPDRSQSDLNQANPWGQEGDASYAYAFDCSRAPIFVTDDARVTRQHVQLDDPQPGSDELDREYWVNLTDEDYRLNVTNAPRAPPGTNLAGASLAGTVNETEEGALGDCDRSDGDGSTGDVYSFVETPHESVQGLRSQTDFEFSYMDSSANGGNNCELRTQPVTCAPLVPQITGSGLQLGYALSWTGGWFGNPSYTASRNPYVNRENLQPWGASYASFYAYVDPSTGTLPPASATTSAYGSDHCTGSTAKPGGAFECDAALWWLDAQGESTYDTDGNGFDFRAVPGEPYNLADVDCYDAAPARGVDGPVSTVGERACER